MDDLESADVACLHSEPTMDPNLFMAMKRGEIDIVHEFASRDGDLDKVTPLGNTVLHVAARFGNKDVLEEIFNLQPSLFHHLHKRNRQGKTPMHMVARAGEVDVVKILINCMKTKKKDEHSKEPQKNILLMGDDEGNTPLHTAVRNNHIDVVKLLIAEDPEPILSANKAGQSPLSIAIDASLTDIARWIISNTPKSLDHIGPNQQTLLHSAVLRAEYAVMLDILKTKKELIKIVDKNKWNALHYAAVSGYCTMAKGLVKHDPSLAYQFDNKGRLPLHLAVENNQLLVLEMLINHSPYVVEVLDKSNRNILHLAAKYGFVDIVFFILKLPEIEDLINSPDKDGNTPLHLAAMEFQSDVVFILSRYMKVNIRATNNNGITALEMIQSTEDHPRDTLKIQEESADDEEPEHKQRAEETCMKNSPKYSTTKALKAAYADRALDPEDILEYTRFGGTKSFDNPDEKCKEIANTLLLMATLISSFTFAAAFTIPGGYEQDGPDKGLATLARKTGFQAFVVTDTIAMTSSMTAAVIILLTLLSPKRSDYNCMDIIRNLYLAILFTWVGLVSMTLAFVTGLFVVLSNNMALAALACSIGCGLSITCYFIGPVLMMRWFDGYNLI